MSKIEEIYNAYGKYDNVVTIIFHNGSVSMSIYGKSVTGLFHYSQNDRKHLELQMYSNTSEPLKQRFQIILKKDYSKEVVNDAFQQGVLVDDIDYIITLPNEKFNEFLNNNQRSMPEPLVVEIDSSSWGNMDYVELGLYRRRMADRQLLTEYEQDRFAALTLIYKPENVNDEFLAQYVLDETGSMKKSVKYEKVQIEYYSGHALDISPEHAEMLNWKGEEVNKLVRTELRKVGIASKTDMYVNLWLYNFLLEKGVQFTPEILLYSNPPVYMDYESWLHIFLKHAEPLMKGKHVQSRTPFQYALKDIFDLLKHLVHMIKDDIEHHYVQNGQKEFTRNGLYYNGDYYKIKLSSKGRVETIFKIKKPIIIS